MRTLAAHMGGRGKRHGDRVGIRWSYGGRLPSDRANLVLLAVSNDRERDNVAALRRASKGQPNRPLTARVADRILSVRRLVKCVQC